MQVLNVIASFPGALANAARIDWKQFLCVHDFGFVGTTYGNAKPVPGEPGLWDMGWPTSYHYRCKKCDKPRQEKLS